MSCNSSNRPQNYAEWRAQVGRPVNGQNTPQTSVGLRQRRNMISAASPNPPPPTNQQAIAQNTTYNPLTYTNSSKVPSSNSGPSMISSQIFAPATRNPLFHNPTRRHGQGWNTSSNPNSANRHGSRTSLPFPSVKSHVYHDRLRASHRAAGRNSVQSEESTTGTLLRRMDEGLNLLSLENPRIPQVPLVPQQAPVAPVATASTQRIRPKKFSDLPTELRLEIWDYVSHHPRLLELQWDSAHRQPYPSHVYYCLTPKSRIPSAVLHVNHESRQEALRFYRRVDFTTVRANQVMQPGYVSCGSIWTYYNPNSDIVLFAEKTCMNTVVRFLEDQRTNMVPIVRIAILTSGMTLNCHGWRSNDPIKCAQKLTIAGGCSPMQALHGIDPAVAQNTLVLGVKGLKDVYWVVPSELLPLRAGDIDESVGFRNAVGDGLMNGQKYFKELIAADVAFVERGSPLPKCGSFDYWSGPNKPSFHFVSFSPHPAPGKVFDSLPILTATIPKLNFRSWERVKKIAQQTGCHIKVCVEHYIEQSRREVGFYGTPEQVSKAKEAVKNFLSVNQNWTPPRQHYPETALGFRSSTHPDFLVTRDPEFTNRAPAATKY